MVCIQIDPKLLIEFHCGFWKNSGATEILPIPEAIQRAHK